MPAEPVEPLTPWLFEHPHRSIVVADLGGTRDGYQLPVDLPERIAREWTGPTSIVGSVHLVAFATFWRPIAHFHRGSYLVLPEHEHELPPEISENTVLELVVEGLLLPGAKGCPRLTGRDQIQQTIWRGVSWARGTHIAPPPGRLTVELVRPDSWRQPSPPRAHATVEQALALT